MIYICVYYTKSFLSERLTTTFVRKNITAAVPSSLIRIYAPIDVYILEKLSANKIPSANYRSSPARLEKTLRLQQRSQNLSYSPGAENLRLCLSFSPHTISYEISRITLDALAQLEPGLFLVI